MVTIQTAENALKTVYLGAVTELLNTKVNPLLTKIEQTSTDVWGKEIRRAVSYGINGGIGAGDEDYGLPEAAGNKYLQFVAGLKNLYGQIEISDKAIQASNDAKGAFVNLLNAELQGLLDASRFNLGRMLYGDGTGLLTTIGASSTNAYPIEKPNFLVEGLVVDIYSGNTRTHNGLRISFVDHDNRTVSFENPPSTAVAANSTLFVQGSRNREITGLGAIFGGGDIYGVSRDAHPFLTPYQKAVNGQIDEIVIQEGIDRLENVAGSTVDFIAVAADVKYAYQEFMGQFKRNIDIMELEGGFRTLSYNGIPLVYDRFVEDGAMYLLNTKSFKMHQLCDWRYLENESGKILRQAADRPTFTATLVKYCDLICSRPNGQGKLTGITR
ncbi:MAG: phage major capsid protein [Firmicutes bacterium]|nr:phage major capsid protein [Bacillota bacterium]